MMGLVNKLFIIYQTPYQNEIHKINNVHMFYTRLRSSVANSVLNNFGVSDKIINVHMVCTRLRSSVANTVLINFGVFENPSYQVLMYFSWGQTSMRHLSHTCLITFMIYINVHSCKPVLLSHREYLYFDWERYLSGSTP